MNTDPLLARVQLRAVYVALEEYRDARRASLLRARAQIRASTFLTSLVAMSLLVIAVLLGAPRAGIGAAVSFFLLGALAGLFYRMYSEKDVEYVVEDYGLGLEKIPHAALLCGLAALGGVLFAAFGAPALVSSGVTPAPSPDAPSVPLPALNVVFDINANRVGILVALLFGLTPGLLLKRFDVGEKARKDLAASDSQ